MSKICRVAGCNKLVLQSEVYCHSHINHGEKDMIWDPVSDNPMDVQIGGGHYKDMAIQPFEFSMKNKQNPGQATVIKYVSRYQSKGGRQDLEKAIHVIQMMIELEYPE